MTRMHTPLALAALLALAAVTSGCEDTPLTAGSDWEMTVTANPAAVTFDPNTGVNSADIDIQAVLLDAAGAPQSGVTVYFSANAPGLQSGTAGVKTDGAGVARDVLLLQASTTTGDVNVVANSASLTGSAQVAVTKAALNKPPQATIATSPTKEQASGGAVIFDGSGSGDPDASDFITMYKWVVTSTNPDTGKSNPIVAEGAGVSALAVPNDALSAFVNVQDLTVSLSVTEDPAAPLLFESGFPVSYRDTKSILYSIVKVRCDDNTAPTATLSGADQQQIFGLPFAIVSFTLDGSLSTDRETLLETYNFSCGNGSTPSPIPGTQAKVTCRYLVDNVPRTYTATLSVVDRGTGRLVNGQYECNKESQPDSVTVTVSPLATGGD